MSASTLSSSTETASSSSRRESPPTRCLPSVSPRSLRALEVERDVDRERRKTGTFARRASLVSATVHRTRRCSRSTTPARREKGRARDADVAQRRRASTPKSLPLVVGDGDGAHVRRHGLAHRAAEEQGMSSSGARARHAIGEAQVLGVVKPAARAGREHARAPPRAQAVGADGASIARPLFAAGASDGSERARSSQADARAPRRRRPPTPTTADAAPRAAVRGRRVLRRLLGVRAHVALGHERDYVGRRRARPCRSMAPAARACSVLDGAPLDARLERAMRRRCCAITAVEPPRTARRRAARRGIARGAARRRRRRACQAAAVTRGDDAVLSHRVRGGPPRPGCPEARTPKFVG